MGYQKYDRRKKHIRELDEKAAAILAAQGAVSGAESEGVHMNNFRSPLADVLGAAAAWGTA